MPLLYLCPNFPSVNEQKREIENRIASLYAGEIAIPSEVVDEVLRTGGNRSKSQLRIIYNFMSEQTPEEYTEFVKRSMELVEKALKSMIWNILSGLTKTDCRLH